MTSFPRLRASALRLLAVACVGASAVGVGCSTRTGKLDDYARFEAVDPDLSPEVAQLLMMEFGVSAESLIQTRLPEILEQQTDPMVIESVQTFGDGLLAGIRRTAWRVQPIGGAFDSAIFLEQVRSFLAGDRAKETLGPAVPDLQGLVAGVDEIFRQSVNEILKEEDIYPENVRAWVQENPIEDANLFRASPIPQVADDASARVNDALVAVADADFTARSIYNRLNAAIASIPQDVRTEVQRSLRALKRESLVVNALIGLARLGDGMKETAVAISGVDQRLARMQDIILVEIDRQRLETIEVIQGEREIILETVAAERETILEAVSMEREAVMTELRSMVLDETSGALAGVGETANSAVDRVISGIQNTVLLGLLGLLMIVVLALAFQAQRRN